jgi:hypothetical protein
VSSIRLPRVYPPPIICPVVAPQQETVSFQFQFLRGPPTLTPPPATIRRKGVGE